MKKLFSLLSMLFVSMGAFAQGSLLATLSHDGQISAFYGADALKKAHEAAATGDVITLSSGQFNAVDITKPITLRGAGMNINTDSLSRHEATIIQGELAINVSTDSQTGYLNMEGLYFNSDIKYNGTLENAQFLKCRFQRFISNENAKIINTSFIHCRIRDGYTQRSGSNAYFINSIVCSPTNNSGGNSIEFDNCFVKFDRSSSYGKYAGHVTNSYYKNCIIQAYAASNEPYQIPFNCTAYNCLGLNTCGDINMFSNILNNTNWTKAAHSSSSLKSVFKTYNSFADGSYITNSEMLVLTEEAAAMYLGTDGKQVGIYGGNLPYDENPTTPQIIKCDVASKSTADGKLSVDIEVKAAEY